MDLLRGSVVCGGVSGEELAAQEPLRGTEKWEKGNDPSQPSVLRGWVLGHIHTHRTGSRGWGEWAGSQSLDISRCAPAKPHHGSHTVVASKSE